MAKQVSTSTRKEKTKRVIREKTQERVEDEISKEKKPFDFGGLPMRDLKKNLGCG